MSGFKAPNRHDALTVQDPKDFAQLRQTVNSLQREVNDIKAKSNKLMLELERAVIGNITQVVNNVLASGGVSIITENNTRFGTQAFAGTGTKTVAVSPAVTSPSYTVIGFIVYADEGLSPFVTTSTSPTSFTRDISGDCSISWIVIF